MLNLTLTGGFMTAVGLAIAWTTAFTLGITAHTIGPVIALFAGFWGLLPLMAVSASRYVKSRRPCMVIDRIAGVLIPAQRFSPRPPDAIPLTAIITLERAERRSRIRGDNLRAIELNVDWLALDGTAHATTLARWNSILTDEDESLEKFLRAELALPEPNAP